MSGRRRSRPDFRFPRLATLLTAAGFALIAGAALALMTGGIRIAAGPLRISAVSPSRMFFEGSVALLLADVASRAPARWRTAVVLTLLMVSAAFDSSPRRVGDGFEYLAMARTVVRSGRPSVDLEDVAAVQHEASAAGDTTWVSGVAPPDPTLRGADGRYDFPHFWMYSLVAAPFVAVATATGHHPAAGFTALNLLLLTLACAMLVLRGAGSVAILFASLLFWWIDKAHAEVFITSLTVIALLNLESRPMIALVLLGAVAAQMPIMGVLFACCAVMILARRRTPTMIGAAVVALAVAVTHPAYYLWRLGVWSPLRSSVIVHLPGVTALATPVLDPNLGIAWFAPMLVLLIGIGAWSAIGNREWETLLPLTATAAALLLAASQTPNVNHGGTPGMSRYGVWVAGVLVPMAVLGAAHARERWPSILRIAVGATLLFAALFLHPRFGDAGTRPAPTPLADMIWRRWPAIDNPLPEVFAERVGHVDGRPPVPVATEGCEKALVIGTGVTVAWPPQCRPTTPPRSCVTSGALCYANGATFTPAPEQPGFTPAPRDTDSRR